MKYTEILIKNEFESWMYRMESAMKNPYSVTFNYLFDDGTSRAPSEEQFKKDLDLFSKRLRNRWYSHTLIKRHNINIRFTPFKLETTDKVGLHCHGIIDVPKRIKRPDIGISICWPHGEAYTEKDEIRCFSKYMNKLKTSINYENFQDNFHIMEWNK